MNEEKKNTSQKEPSIETINLAIKSINENDHIGLKKIVGQMIDSFPNGSTSWLFSAIYHSQINELNISENHIIKVFEINPNYGEAHRVYSDILRRKNNKRKCLKHALKAVEINTSNAAALDTLGTAYAFNNDQISAEKCFLKAINLQSNSSVIYNNLGNTQRHLGKYKESILSFKNANKLDPNIIEIYTNLSLTFFEIEEYKKALETLDICQKNIKNFLNNNYVDLYTSYGHIFSKIHQNKKAIEYYKKALKINNHYSPANNGIGEAYLNMRMYSNGLEHFKLAFENSPNIQNSISNYLLSFNYLTDFSRQRKYEETLKYSNYKIIKKNKTFKNSKIKNKKLKIGFVSGDYFHHPVSYFLINFIENIDTNKFEIIAYNNSFKNDSFSERLKKSFSDWFEIYHLSNEGIISKIFEDKIDILFDLSGHTGRNRLEIFKTKAAPIQISWLGYSNTTGIKEIDYILCDEISIPKDEEKWFVEKPLRMSKSYYNFSKPLKNNLKIKNRDNNKNIVFGCFNNPKKINDNVLSLWCDILQNIPESKLILKYKYYKDENIKKGILEFFLSQGLNQDRISFLTASERKDYLNDFNKIDISLDPFPYPGGTTTCESLYMGVPVITLEGNDFLSRNSENILINSDLKKYIAKSKKEYKKIAINISQNIGKLNKEEIRGQFLKSSIMDGKNFTRELELNLVKIWNTYCQDN